MTNELCSWEKVQFYYCNDCNDVQEYVMARAGYVYKCPGCKKERFISACVTDRNMGFTISEAQKAEDIKWRMRSNRERERERELLLGD